MVAAILHRGPAQVLVNDSHGDIQNLLHTDLDPRVEYVQGAVKLDARAPNHHKVVIGAGEYQGGNLAVSIEPDYQD